MWNDENNTLTIREKEVLQYICRGLTNKEIGEIMYISKYTVRTYISSILYKLKVKNRTEAVYKAIKNNLV